MLSPLQTAALILVALFAGTIDAMAGGGGLLTVPALLAVGLPPSLVLATNKGQAVFGAAASTYAFARAGGIDLPRARYTFPLGALGAVLGAQLVMRIAPATLRPVILVLLVGAAVLLTFRRGAIVGPVREGGTAMAIGGVIAFVLGTYDGFFGPGTGTFLALLFARFLGDSLTRATGNAKVVNFGTNLAAFLVFAQAGAIVWSVALPMACAQIVGGVLGARFALRGGETVVRRAVLGVVLALVLKLGWDLVRAHV